MILTSSQVKAFVLHFVRDVASSKLQEAWIRDLTVYCESGCDSVIAQGMELAGRMPDVRSSQRITYVLFPDRVDVLLDGEGLGSLTGARATQTIQAAFLGPKAPQKLRKELIGS